MRLFLTILEGQNPIDAEPILATEDGRLIRLVGSWIALVIVIPIIIWAFGPALYLLYLREKRLDEESPGRARRILARKSSRRTAEEPAQ